MTWLNTRAPPGAAMATALLAACRTKIEELRSAYGKAFAQKFAAGLETGSASTSEAA